MRKQFVRWALEQLWYGRYACGHILAPLGILYGFCALFRRACYRTGLVASTRVGVPVIVVGNIAVGGTGKTPLTIWLAAYLKRSGFRPGVICSGFGGNARTWPQQVRADSDPSAVGDEAVLIAEQTGCPVAAGRDRVASAQALLTYQTCDVLVSDDGLQHYRLARDVEIVVIDGMRRHGTGWCFPAGPLREPRIRMRAADFVVANGSPRRGEIGMSLSIAELRRVGDDSVRLPPLALKGQEVHGVAGIGNPDRFFAQLRNLGLRVVPHPFPDHYPFSAEDFRWPRSLPIVMTEKDAVKCRSFAPENSWYLPVVAAPEPQLGTQVLTRLRALGTVAGQGEQTNR